MIKVKLHGRLGNQLFQFAFGYLISKKNRVLFLVDVEKNRFYLEPFKLAFPYNLLGNPYFLRVYGWLVRKIKMKRKHDYLDLQTKFEWPLQAHNTYFNGYFQDAELMEGDKKSLQRLFSVKASYQKIFKKKYDSFFKNRKCLVISMRLGQDYKDFVLPDLDNANVFLPNEWYTSILYQIEEEFDKVIIISDVIDEAQQILGAKPNYIYINEPPEIQFQMLLNADACIIGNSSYSWWGGFLNTKQNKKIYAPLYWAGYNAGHEYPVGIMTKEFIWVS